MEFGTGAGAPAAAGAESGALVGTTWSVAAAEPFAAGELLAGVEAFTGVEAFAGVEPFAAGEPLATADRTGAGALGTGVESAGSAEAAVVRSGPARPCRTTSATTIRVNTAAPTAAIPRLAPNDGAGEGRTIRRGGK